MTRRFHPEGSFLSINDMAAWSLVGKDFESQTSLLGESSIIHYRCLLGPEQEGTFSVGLPSSLMYYRQGN